MVVLILLVLVVQLVAMLELLFVWGLLEQPILVRTQILLLHLVRRPVMRLVLVRVLVNLDSILLVLGLRRRVAVMMSERIMLQEVTELIFAARGVQQQMIVFVVQILGGLMNGRLMGPDVLVQSSVIQLELGTLQTMICPVVVQELLHQLGLVMLIIVILMA